MFGLQDGNDEYQNNPPHYLIDREEPDDAQGGRYPPVSNLYALVVQELTIVFRAGDILAYQHRSGWKENVTHERNRWLAHWVNHGRRIQLQVERAGEKLFALDAFGQEDFRAA